jgi:hypothetical protein
VRLAVELVHQTPERGRPRQLVVTGGRDDDDRCSGDAPREVGQEPQGHLVRPVQVLERQRDRLSRGQTVDDLGHALEEAEVILAGRGRPLRAHLGKQTGQLGAPCRADVGEHVRIGGDPAGPERIDPRAERKDLLALVCAAEQDPKTPALRLAR